MIILGLAGGLIDVASLPWYLALSLGSGLVMTHIVAPAVTTSVGLSVPSLSVATLLV